MLLFNSKSLLSRNQPLAKLVVKHYISLLLFNWSLQLHVRTARNSLSDVMLRHVRLRLDSDGDKTIYAWYRYSLYYMQILIQSSSVCRNYSWTRCFKDRKNISTESQNDSEVMSKIKVASFLSDTVYLRLHTVSHKKSTPFTTAVCSNFVYFQPTSVMFGTHIRYYRKFATTTNKMLR